MKFVVSYSGGKDSTLALHKMLAEGHTPVGLLVMYNTKAGRSWFHGVDNDLLDAIGEALGIPLIRCPSDGEDYHTALEDGLRRAREGGAQAAVFGDIDIEENRAWCEARCEAAGLPGRFPLWRRDRVENTMELVELGYDCRIKCVRNADLPLALLGRRLDAEVIGVMREKEVDVCGENGEYHTVVVDGPIFRHPVPVAMGKVLDLGHVSVIDMLRDSRAKG